MMKKAVTSILLLYVFATLFQIMLGVIRPIVPSVMVVLFIIFLIWFSTKIFSLVSKIGVGLFKMRMFRRR